MAASDIQTFPVVSPREIRRRLGKIDLLGAIDYLLSVLPLRSDLINFRRADKPERLKRFNVCEVEVG